MNTSPDFDLNNGPMSRHAAEWGLASLFIAGVLAIMALVTLILNIFIGTMGRQLMNAADLRLALNAVFVGLALIAFLALFSIGCGIKGLVSARSRLQPAALPLAGILLSLFALVMWIIAGYDLIAILKLLGGPVQWGPR